MEVISYKKLIDRLKANGLNQNQLKKQGILGSAVITKIFEKDGVNGNGVDMRIIDRLCKILDCQPGDVLERVPDPPGYSDSAKKWGPDKKFKKE